MNNLRGDIHFINGHKYNHQGAYGYEKFSNYEAQKVTEWEYANSLHLLLKTPYTYADAYSIGNLPSEFIKADTLALEFHLNSFNSPDIEGYEVLVLEGDEQSKKYAKLFLHAMKLSFPKRRNRGIKLINESDRGYNNLIRLKKYYKQAIITEAFFLNNPDDWIPREDMANVINALTDCMGQ